MTLYISVYFFENCKHIIYILDNSRDHPAPIIRAVDHNQEVFEGGNTNLRCILPGSKEVSNTPIFSLMII